MTNLCEKSFELIVVAGFALIFTVLSTRPISDGDFFWHIHSGQEILANRALPECDSFSFTTAQFVDNQSADLRIPVILKQYWLAQIALYWLHEYFGDVGIVALRALVFAAILTILYLWGRTKASWSVSGCLTILTASLLLEYPTERPQLFSFLLAVVVLFLLEKLRCEDRWRYGCLSLSLPLAMLLWGNLHGGYLLGVGFCCLYVAGHGLGAMKSGTVDWRYLCILLSSVGIAFVNPCGTSTFHAFLSSDDDYFAMVYEALSPAAAFRHGDYYWAYWLFVLLVIGSFGLLRRRIVREHAMILAGLLILSMTGLRYMIFLPMSFPLFIGAYARVARMQSAAAMVLTMCLFLSGANFSAAGQFGVSDRFPLAAGKFLREKLPGRDLYNHYDWGGYLSFVLPGSRIFIDGRGLVPAVVREYNAIKDANDYSEKLRKYGANAIVMPGLGAASGKIYPLVKALYGDDRWQLVYWDEVALVFVPADDVALRSIATVDKKFIFRHAVSRVDRLLGDANRGEKLSLLQTRAESQLLLGDYAGARRSCQSMLKIDASNSAANKLLATLERF